MTEIMEDAFQMDVAVRDDSVELLTKIIDCFSVDPGFVKHFAHSVRQ